ncbi:hypothetical protein GGQ99_005063 [Aminobacter niigataensis]|uniref:Uncharacterized protein n=1 Tax=Aminobacter niigataensis TaxID=83265 RepID=A0ABR6L9K7_9HYPH|nr:hypothetical protein [Aminobacter niigataensis]MBB4653278.1 hypothetical protein [Aminobacter niigataensis]
MTAYVTIEPGQWAVVFPDEFFNQQKSFSDNVFNLIYRGCGWNWASDQVLVLHHVSRVMPRTFEAGGRWRVYRETVVAAANTREQAEHLRSTLLAIGIDADNEIEREVAKLSKPIERRVRTAALKKLEAALPHIFGVAP